MAISDSFPGKSPADKLWYAFDFTRWAAVGDPVVAATLDVEPTGDILTISQVLVPPFFQFMLDGGSDGTTYTVTCVGTLASGQIVQHSATLTVSEN